MSAPLPPPVLLRPPPREASPLSLHFRLFVWVGADAGTLASVAPALGAVGVIAIGRQRIDLGAVILPLQREVSPLRATAGGDADLAAVTASTCRDLLGRTFELGPCLGFEIGRIEARGFGVFEPGEGAALWVAFTAGGMLVYRPVPEMGFGLRLGAAVPFARPRFVLGGVDLVDQPGPVAARAAIGVELTF